MKSEISSLICDLETITETAECLVYTFMAIEDGMVNGGSFIPPQAICMPITALDETVKELRSLKNKMVVAGLKKAGADK